MSENWADGIELPERFKIDRFTQDGEGNTTSTRHVLKDNGKAVKAPLDFATKRISTQYDAEGEVRQQWHIQAPTQQQQQQRLEAWLAEACEMIPAKPLIPPPVTRRREDLMVAYPVGDHHLGMLAWKHEVGESNDIEIAEKMLADAMAYLTSRAPEAEVGLVAIMGDFFHYDSFDSVTPTNRNILDSDGRAPKMISAGVRLLERSIDLALQHHNHVHVIIELGNHDLYSAVWAARFMERIYRDNPRVKVDLNSGHFHYLEWKNNLIGTHHGHGRKARPADLPGIMASDQREAWGRTKHHYWYTGHIHHQTVYDFHGTKVESFPILPPGDAYAYNEGYRSKREMKVITYHAEHGEWGRLVIRPEMLK